MFLKGSVYVSSVDNGASSINKMKERHIFNETI